MYLVKVSRVQCGVFRKDVSTGSMQSVDVRIKVASAKVQNEKHSSCWNLSGPTGSSHRQTEVGIGRCPTTDCNRAVAVPHSLLFTLTAMPLWSLPDV